MSVNLSYYDITQIDYIADANDLVIPQSGAWIPLAVGFDGLRITKRDNRLEHRGNKQTLNIDKEVKQWFEFELELINLKYDAGPPIFDWWDLVNKAFYGGATGAPVLRPSTVALGVKLNYATPEYWTLLANKLTGVLLRGNFTTGAAMLILRGLARKGTLNTTNYIQGTATRNADPAKTPMVPSNDITILLDGVDRTTELMEFELELTRAYEMHGVAASPNQKNFREFVPNSFDGRLRTRQDPLRTEHMTKYIDDTAITCEIKAQNATNGKQIQFTAAKHKGTAQEHRTGASPSMLDLTIDGSTFNVANVA